MAAQVLLSTVFPALKLRSLQEVPCGASPHLKAPPGKMVIKIPDMFKSFMSATPKVNPFYEEVKLEADTWITEKLDANEKMKKTITKTDFA
ncbi:hypothetical protein ONS95_005810 [Cadophora gregata]|uniref:uncharacterized protein n=1 Tax=Cadophora gregata TaxID=51156 RepID=UPI0026DBDD6D|nr:uncharacterized protein ONS95_005810 [Cadophora gregata]KAK0103811.1 hypothetical protein ONS95_005810 [Cadophora gregata]KAK0107997.1 hypothetical protein ONS96_003775 [Cadophora gregata f. sp. sojae]